VRSPLALTQARPDSGFARFLFLLSLMAEDLSSMLRAVLGMGVFLGLCWAASEQRRRINWRLVGSGIGLQFALAVLILKVPGTVTVFDWIAQRFVDLLAFSGAGAEFLFGGLVTDIPKFGFIFAMQVLPTIIFFAAFSSVLYYLGILQRIVFAFAWVMKKTMRLSGAESLATAGNIFLGQTEAPLLIRPYLAGMTRSEIMTLMTGGMATIAGGVMVAYIGLLGGDDPAAKVLFARHLLTASILSAPAAIVAAKILVPETEPIDENLALPRDRLGTNVIDAAVIGTTDGVKLALNVGGALLAFTALVALVNAMLTGGPGAWFGLNTMVASVTGGAYEAFTLQSILGFAFAPAAWLIGVADGDLLFVGQLLGERCVLNEFVAYATLADMKANGSIRDPRSLILVTYALCGFANLVSMGIQVGGIGALAPERRPVLAALAFKAMAGGTIACLFTACVASFFV
jgi:concentrative nucleoside transporter, CNT family